jgi:hypothetical protein
MARVRDNTEEWRQWVAFVATREHQGEERPLPEEDLPAVGAAGGPSGWPEFMLSRHTVTKMRDEGITRTSQILQLADCMTEDQFRGFIEGLETPRDEFHQLFHGVLVTWLGRVDTGRVFHRRVPGGDRCEWNGQNCHTNNSLLRPHLRSAQLCWDGQPQGPKIARAIQANNDRYVVWRGLPAVGRQLSDAQIIERRNAN